MPVCRLRNTLDRIIIQNLIGQVNTYFFQVYCGANPQVCSTVGVLPTENKGTILFTLLTLVYLKSMISKAFSVRAGLQSRIATIRLSICRLRGKYLNSAPLRITYYYLPCCLCNSAGGKTTASRVIL